MADPERRAGTSIDRLLIGAGRAVQDFEAANPRAARGVALREFESNPGHGTADCLLHLDGKACGVIEAKKHGATLTGVAIQSARCAQDRCNKQGIKPAVYDSIIDKTPLSFRTNRIIGGVAPSEYLARLEKGDAATPTTHAAKLDGFGHLHLIDPEALRGDCFDAFMASRQKQLLRLIEQANGKPAYAGEMVEEGDDLQGDEDSAEAEITIAP